MSDEQDRPDPRTTAEDAVTTDGQDAAPGTGQDTGQDEGRDVAGGPRYVQVTRRRAPRFRAFVLTGLVVAFLVAAVVALLTPPAGGYSQQALFGYLFVALGLLGVLLGGLVAVVLDRRTGRADGRSGRGVRHSGRGPR